MKHYAPLGLTLLAYAFAAMPAIAQQTPPHPSEHAFFSRPDLPTSVFYDATATHVPLAPKLNALDSVLVDVDNDGDLDAVIAVEYGVNRLYLNEGGGRFKYVPGAFGNVMHDNEHVRAADFNGDGNIDVVFVAEEDEVHQLYFGDGRGGFTDVSDRLPRSSQGNALAVGDLNGDGLPDILVGSTGEQGHGGKVVPARNLLFLNDPARPGHFRDASDTLPGEDDQTGGLALADMDGDGDLDIVVGSPTQPNRLLINDGAARFTDASERLDLRVPMETTEVHVFDANGDGLNDILFFNITSNNGQWDKDPQTRLLVNDGKGRFVDETAARLPAHTFSSWAGTVVDFDGDGAQDLLVGAVQVPGFVPLQMRAWRNDGKGHFTDATLDVVPGITVGRSWSTSTGDLDGDGKTDVLIGGWSTQARLLLSDVEGYRATMPESPKLPAPAPFSAFQRR
ncbi:VCBS repeat-containing protein [Corticibacter populi]|uniref:VCBS repeat-containing protein n=1 Tax=Corticibacter populi TaxID=1550736 RepID=A0A3M6QUW5_9BURK|nr:VCBS repeat-containing protein [Corticibacter populi]RMX06820.1 VCBS repeat-containing protein [Corticibacter populi]RZS31591.1 FG-GAP repeat protein [Corticibacter populi]